MAAPLTPANCNLQDFPRMMIDIPRLRASEFDSILDDGAWRAGFNLWMAAWHQVPAASLPDDDASLAKHAGLGRDVRTWRKVKVEALRGWERCDDGLLYHETVAEMALEAWIEKLAQALSSGAGNAKRWNTTFDPAPIEAEIDRAVEMLTSINPKSKALAKVARRKSRAPSISTPEDKPTESHRDADTVPLGSQEKGTGTGTGIIEVVAVERASAQPDDWPHGDARVLAGDLQAVNRNLDIARQPGLITSLGEISRWRLQGYSWLLDVVPAVEAHAARPRSDPVKSWIYFAQAIERNHANRTRPIEHVQADHPHDRPHHDRKQAAFVGRLQDIDGAMGAAFK